jgi:cyclophilin family peptidyl-prolyl cis-trans isomerase
MNDLPKNPTVTFTTSMGTLKIELWPDKAPVTVENFLAYVREGFYDGLIFHRVIPYFVVQAGGFEPGMVYRDPTHPTIKNEADNGEKNTKATLSMARAYPINSAATQFFINLQDNTALDHRGSAPPEFGYAVFGKVIEGIEAVEKMAVVKTGNRGQHQNVPVEDIVITRAQIDEA